MYKKFWEAEIKMKIAILGSIGFLGKEILRKALDSGYEIKTLVRNPEKLGEFKNRVGYIEGNVKQADKLETAVRGTEAVISTMGPPMKKSIDPESYKDAMKNLLQY